MKNYILILVMLISSVVFTAEDGTKQLPKVTDPKKSETDLIYEKSLSENTKEVEKLYTQYQAALSKSTEKVLKSLELAKQDFNDFKKYPKMSIQERAKEISNLEEKIKEVKDGSIVSFITSNTSSSLLGEKSLDSTKIIVGVWMRNLKSREYTFNEDGSYTQNGTAANNGKWIYTKNKVILTAIEGSVTTLVIKSNTEMTGSMSDGTSVTFTKK